MTVDPHTAWLAAQCRNRGATLLVLDTWTSLSPGADPMGAKDQATLAAVVVEIADAISGAVVVVDHSRKNRAEGEPISSADIYGPLQKWATAEHIVMFDLTRDRQRLEVFEGKDGETRRFFLAVTPKGEPGEKFKYSGTVDEIAAAQREKGNQNLATPFTALYAPPARRSRPRTCTPLWKPARRSWRSTPCPSTSGRDRGAARDPHRQGTQYPLFRNPGSTVSRECRP